MAFNDPIAELLTKIRNASLAQNRFVDIEPSKMKMSIIKILSEQGYIARVLHDATSRRLRIFLKYTGKRKPVLNGLKRVSSPGLRRYVSCKNIPSIFGGIGTSILSTSKGIVDDKKARELNLGGELLCIIW